eukprot:1152215-Pelagomonas_calceolata.AAC.2
MQLISHVDICTYQAVSAVTLIEALQSMHLQKWMLRTKSDAVSKLSVLLVETRKVTVRVILTVDTSELSSRHLFASAELPS